ncbi:uncharacterized protein METZ01_LOCUS94761 [marine metagenome]|uniref:Major facilitator superfamily (MFS) profile domain-containing protein n=1 Tax=marine metagenome TaxID=408172 RepID=A0A381VQJ3_9ZZZZ
MTTSWKSALKYKDFRFLWVGTACQAVGFGMDNVALGWLVYELTSSPFMVGLAAALRMVPLFVLGVLSGVIADKVERRILLRYVTLAGGLVMVLLGGLLITGFNSVWLVIFLATVAGASFAFLLTLRQSYTYDIVGPENSLSGLSMLQIGSTAGAIFGSLLAGLLIEMVGAGWQFIVVGFTYFISFIVLFGARSSGQSASQISRSVRSNLVGYLSLLREYPILLILMCLASITEIFGFSHMSLIPVFAKEVFSVGSVGLGLLTSIRQLGGFIGLSVLAAMGDFRKKGFLMFVIAISFGLGQMAVFKADSVILYGGLLLFLNACAMSVDTLYKTLMQQNVPNEHRGTAMGSWVLSIGTGPVGHLGVGAIAGVYGAPFAMLFNGLFLSVCGIGTALSLPKIRKLP